MEHMRIEYATKNAATSILLRFLEQLLAFVSRTVFIYFLTVEYLGITSLFSNILNVLNLAELGIGTAINVALYGPLANNDKEKIKSLMSFYKRAYFYIGLAILVIGCAIVPFLQFLMKGTTNLVNIKAVYLIYIAKSVLSYWIYAYKRSIFEADQKSYVVSLITYAVICAWKIIQIMFLFILRKYPTVSFYVYCGGDAFCCILENVIISMKANKCYPYINEKDIIPLTKKEKNNLFKDVYGVALYKISATVNSSADSIIISSFLGTIVLGLFSNYLMIVNAIMSIIGVAFNSITATIGNINVQDSVEKKHNTFNILNLIYFWVYSFCFVCLWVLLNPFVCSIWLGPSYQLSDTIIFTMCLNFLVDGLMGSAIIFRNACGLFWQSRYRAVATVIINVVLSVLSVTIFNLGVEGILMATIISRLAVTLWVDGYLVFKNVFNSSPKIYFINYFCSLLLAIVTGLILKIICGALPEGNVIFFVLKLILCIIVPNLIWCIIFKNTVGFTTIKEIVAKLIKRIFNINIKNSI